MSKCVYQGSEEIAVCMEDGVSACPFCAIELSRTGKPSEHPYAGSYQNQDDFPSDNIEFIVGAKGITLYEVVTVMKELSGDVKWMKWLLGLILAALLATLVTRAI